MKIRRENPKKGQAQVITHTVFVGKLPEAGQELTLDRDEQHHLFKVFRARVGDLVRLLDGCGRVAEAEVRSDLSLQIVAVKTVPPPAQTLHLVFAIPRRNQLDLLLKQAVELGAAELHPVWCRRSVAKPETSERWTLLLQEACKQSHNPYLPIVHRPLALPDKLAELKQRQIQLVYGAIGCDRPLSKAASAAWIVGPEGGFAPEELELLERSNAHPLNLGPYILRLETAASCGLAVLRKILGIAAIALLLAGFCGCRQEPTRDPQFRRAANFRAAGEAKQAYYYFRKVYFRYPDCPEVVLALAELCDEELRRPEEALFRYREYLQLLPETSPERPNAEKLLALAKSKIAALEPLPETPEATQLQQLQQENQLLRRQIEALKNYIKNRDSAVKN